MTDTAAATPVLSPVMTYDRVCAIVRKAGEVEARRCDANGKPDAAREVRGAVNNILQSLQNEAVDSRYLTP